MASASSSDDEMKKKIHRKRKANSESRNERGPPTIRTLKQYTIEEKLEIINFAKQSGNRAAGREYNVAESSIREWRKNEERLRATLQNEPSRNRLVGGGRKPTERRGDDSENPEPEPIQVPLSLRLMGEDTMNSTGSSSLNTSSDPSTTPSPSHSDEKRARVEVENINVCSNDFIGKLTMAGAPTMVHPTPFVITPPNLLEFFKFQNPAFLGMPNLAPLLENLQQKMRAAPVAPLPKRPAPSAASRRKTTVPKKLVMENEEQLPVV
ncbi:unnamed protein product, partial [Mesorhabditis spiculigera]